MIDLFDEHLVEGRRAFHTQTALLELLAKTSSSPASSSGIGPNATGHAPGRSGSRRPGPASRGLVFLFWRPPAWQGFPVADFPSPGSSPSRSTGTVRSTR